MAVVIVKILSTLLIDLIPMVNLFVANIRQVWYCQKLTIGANGAANDTKLGFQLTPGYVPILVSS
jgi:hypothetical protein